MSFNIQSVFNEMLAAASDVLSAEWSKVKNCVENAFEDERDALKDIAQAYLGGEINEDEMKSQLEDEEEVLKAALLACKVAEKVAAQKAANAAISVLEGAIKAAL